MVFSLFTHKNFYDVSLLTEHFFNRMVISVGGKLGIRLLNMHAGSPFICFYLMGGTLANRIAMEEISIISVDSL